MAQRHWQNLIHQKCPDCDSRMEIESKGFKCKECGFFITRQSMAKILTDPTHVAVRFMSYHEREILAKGLENIGVKSEEFIKETSYGQTNKTRAMA